MELFNYHWLGRILQATSDHYTEDLFHRYRILLPDGSGLVIFPDRIMGYESPVLWFALEKTDEGKFPSELIQAIGEGLEGAGLY